MFIGDGAKLVHDTFQLAKEKSPGIIFIDEIDAIGTRRFDRYMYCSALGTNFIICSFYYFSRKGGVRRDL